MISFERWGLSWGMFPLSSVRWATPLWYKLQREKHAFDAKYAHPFY